MINLSCSSPMTPGTTICVEATGISGNIACYVRIDGQLVPTEVKVENGKAKIYIKIPHWAKNTLQVVVSDGVNPQGRFARFIKRP